MRFVILGMLLGEQLSAYDIRRRFEQVVSLFYSASLGSIQRALVVLVDAGHVVREDATGSPRGKRLYRITDTGRAAWAEWMREPVTGSDPEQTMLAKVFFLGRLEEAGERATVIESIGSRVDADLSRLRTLAADPPERSDPVVAYQRATLDFGIRSLELASSWVRGLSAVAS